MSGGYSLGLYGLCWAAGMPQHGSRVWWKSALATCAYLCVPRLHAHSICQLTALPAAFIRSSHACITPGSRGYGAELLTFGVVCLCWRLLCSCSIPTSRLVLKAKPFSCATARQHIASQLEAAGVAAWRFDLLPLTASTQVSGRAIWCLICGHISCQAPSMRVSASANM